MSGDWQDFLDELDRRIETADDEARRERLKAYREKLRGVDPERGARHLLDVAPMFGLRREER